MDESDYANDLTMKTMDIAIQLQRQKAALIPEGRPGECDMCGEWSGRLVNDVCAPCRDKYKLK